MYAKVTPALLAYLGKSSERCWVQRPNSRKPGFGQKEHEVLKLVGEFDSITPLHPPP